MNKPSANFEPSVQDKRSDYLSHAAILARFAQESAITSDQGPQLSEEVVVEIISSGIARASQPSAFGGGELSWEVLCEVAINLGAVDGSLACMVITFA